MKRKPGIQYILSQIIPWHFTTVYRRNDGTPVVARWWQWQNHIFHNKVVTF